MKASEQERPDIVRKRDKWRKTITGIDNRRFFFIDESGAKTNMTRLYGRAFGGRRVVDSVPHGHWNTTTMVAAIGTTGTRAPFVFDGAMDSEMFCAYVKKELVPERNAGDIVIMDNLQCHKNAYARELIEEVGAQIWYLPAYSPDYNPIEKMWSKIKAFIRKVGARTQELLYKAIADALATITQSDVHGWFKSCGYDIL